MKKAKKSPNLKEFIERINPGSTFDVEEFNRQRQVGYEKGSGEASIEYFRT